jgi:acetyltransferase
MLEMFTDPRGVAGSAVQPGEVSFQILHNIVQYGYEGRVYPINPQPMKLFGRRSMPVLGTPDPVDLAAIVVPAKFVPGVLQECGQRGLKGAVIISAGFREVGPQGKALERQVIEIARQYGMRLIGPNVLGIIDTVCKLNASFAAGMPYRGKIAFMSQSGALCTSILDLALGQGVGFSRFYSIETRLISMRSTS